MVQGSTFIKIKINSHDFEFKTYIVKNLTCHIIIGNSFLTKYNAVIKFKDNTLTLNDTIIVKTYNSYNQTNINNITENIINIFNTDHDFSIAHCISADCKMSRGLAAQIKHIFGDATHQLINLKPRVGQVIPIKQKNRIIYYLITKERYFHKPKLTDIKTAIHNLKRIIIKLHDNKVAMPTIATGLDKCNWTVIKQFIYSKFQKTNIKLLICHKNNFNITNSWKSIEHINTINEIQKHYSNTTINKTIKNINNVDNDHIKQIYNTHKPGENVPGDGNCGIYAICNALNNNKNNKITSIANILNLLDLTELPNYWWSDDELASVANYYDHDTYIYNDSNKTGIAYKSNKNNGNHIVLYNTNKNTHWVPGIKSTKPSSRIPIEYITINNITPLKTVLENIKSHIKINNIKHNNTHEIQPIINNKINTPNTQSNNKNISLNTNNTNNIKEIIRDNEGTQINISAHLSPNEHKQAVDLIKEFIHLFTTDTSKVKPANIKPVEIKMKSNYKEPKFNAPHRVSPQQRDELKTQLDKLSKANIIKPIISNFAAPAFLVKKKEQGTYRLVVSYKELNERVEIDQYPLPRTNDLLRALEGSKFFTSIDLNSGFFQIPVRSQDQHKLAFTSVHGLMTFTRLPQGFKNSSAIFQRKLNEAFSALLYKSLIIYIDDLASYGKNFDEALLNLRQAFIIMNKINFSIKTNKCHFFNNKIELLGHSISASGIKPLDKNTKAITEFKQPKTQKDVRSFLGMCSYYRKHIKDFAKIAHPITELTKGDKKKVDWNNEHEQSFITLKQLLTAEPLLKHFDDAKPVFLTIDASLIGLGACLEQPHNNNTLHPVGYASRKLLKNEETYSSTTLELLGLVFGITYFREYLWGRNFIVFCDNISLQYYKNLKIPSARIARLTLKLLDFNFDILYKKGKENKIADALSRNPINNINMNENVDEIPINFNNIEEQQSNDEFCTNIIKALKNKDDNNIPAHIIRKSRQFLINNNILYHKRFTPINNITPILVIPTTLVNQILKSYHESPIGGHTGISRTIHKLQNKYYWPTLTKDTTQYIKSCHNCQINKKMNGKPIGQLQPITLSERPLDRVTFDYLGPLPSSNNKQYILVAACNNTKYIFTKAVTTATGQSTVDFIMHIISLWGCFKQFSSDRGTHFKNKLVTDTCNNLGIKIAMSTSYSPQTQGFVEKINDVICTALRNYINNNNQSRWYYYLPYITLSYNATPHSGTKYSPFYLMHGFEPRFPIDNKIIPENLPFNLKQSLIELNKIRNTIPQINAKVQNIQKKYHDKLHQIIKYEPGDQVLIHFPFKELGKSPKLAPKYRGPFTITKKINDLNYKIKLILNDIESEDIIHVRRLKPYYKKI